MAKKDVSSFRKAMLSKTNVIKDKESDDPAEMAEEGKTGKTGGEPGGFRLDQNVEQEIDRLSKKHHIDRETLVNVGLRFFLEYEKEFFS